MAEIGNLMNPDELQEAARKVAELQEWLDMNGYGRQPKPEPKSVKKPKQGNNG